MSADVQKQLPELRALLGRYDVAGLSAQLSRCEQLLNGQADVNVAVVGRFKAGKSSFLNHLAGCALVPSGVVPVTAVITQLGFGEEEFAMVRFLSGASERIGIDEVAEYVSERGNPENAKGVAQVNVRTPTLQRYGSLRLVDTPGLSSALVHNTETAREWFPKLSAAILAVSVDAPLSEEDSKTLEKLREFSPKTALLLTKVDLLSAAEREEVVAFVRQELRERFGDDVLVFEYSVRPGFEGLRERLDEEWLLTMVRDEVQTRQQIVAHKTRGVAEQLRNYLKVAIAVSTDKANAGGDLRAKIAEERQRFRLLQTEIESLSQRYADKTIHEALKICGGFQRTLTAELLADFDARVGGWNLAVPKLIERYREWMGESLLERLQLLSRREGKAMSQPLVEMTQHMNGLLCGFRDRIARDVRAALGVDLMLREFESDVEPPRSLEVSVGWVFDAPLDLFGYLLPMFVFGAPIRRRLRRTVAFEVEKNLSRLASAWSRRVGNAVRDVAREAEVYADDQLTMLEGALQRREDDLPQLKRDLSEVSSILEEMS